MKKLLFTLQLCALFSIFSYCQNKMASVSLGKEYLSSKSLPIVYSSGNEKDGYLYITIEGTLNIALFDPNTLSLKSKKEIALPARMKNFNNEAIIASGVNYYWIHSDWDKTSGAESLYYDKFDIHSGKFTDQNKVMTETPKLGSTFWYSRTIGKYKIVQDFSGKLTLVNYRLAPEERNNKKSYAKLGFHVFDENMKKVWGQEFTMPYTEALMDVVDVLVDAKANVYLLNKIYNYDKRIDINKETGKPDYHYEVFKYSGDKMDPVKTIITTAENFIKEESFKENSNHDIVLALTYSGDFESKETEGIFIASIGKTGELKKYKNGFHEFPQPYPLQEEQHDGKKSKESFKPSKLAIRDIIFEKDGSIFIACEVYGTDKLSFSSGGQVSTLYTNYYYDIVAGKINTDGNFEWVKIIPKKQSGYYSETLLSFKVFSDATGYYLLYLNNKDIVRLTVKELQKKYYDKVYDGELFVSKITNDGQVTKELIHDNNAADMIFLLPQFSKINKNQFIGRAWLKKDGFKPVLLKIN